MPKHPISNHFDIREFVPEHIWNAYKENAIWFIDPRLVDTCEKIRNHFDKPVIINNWHLGGTYQNSGYRTPDTRVGSRLSQHKFGRAADLKISGYTYEELRNIVRTFYSSFGVTCIEKNTPTWLHIDIRSTYSNKLLEVNFK